MEKYAAEGGGKFAVVKRGIEIAECAACAGPREEKAAGRKKTRVADRHGEGGGNITRDHRRGSRGGGYLKKKKKPDEGEVRRRSCGVYVNTRTSFQKDSRSARKPGGGHRLGSVSAKVQKIE